LFVGENDERSMTAGEIGYRERSSLPWIAATVIAGNTGKCRDTCKICCGEYEFGDIPLQS
jgi:hypothetical protein